MPPVVIAPGAATSGAGRGAPTAKPPPAPQTTYSATVKTSGHPTAGHAQAAIHQATAGGKPVANAGAKAAAGQKANASTPSSSTPAGNAIINAANQPAPQQLVNPADVVNPLAGAPALTKNNGLPPFTPLTTAQLAQQASTATLANTNAALTPLKAQAAQITQNQTQAAQNVAGFTQQDLTQMGNILSQAGTTYSGLIDQSRANATQVAGLLGQAGTSAASLANGYLSPDAQAALAAQQRFQGVFGGAQTGLVTGLAANETGELGALVPATVMRGEETQNNIATSYNKLLAANQASQDTLISKEAPAALQEADTLASNQFKEYDILAQLGYKGQALQNQATQISDNYNIAKGKLVIAGLTELDTRNKNSATAAYQAATVNEKQWLNTHPTAYQQGLLNLRQWQISSNNQLRSIDQQLKRQGLGETKRHDLATEANNLKKALTSPAQYKAVGDFYTAVQVYNTLTTQPSLHNDPVAGQPGKFQKVMRVDHPDEAHAQLNVSSRFPSVIADAAFQYAYYNYVNAPTLAALRASGITPPAAWSAQGQANTGPLPKGAVSGSLGPG